MSTSVYCCNKICSLQFREDDKQEGDILKLVLLGLDICASFLLTIISLSKHVKESGLNLTDEAAAASVWVFSIIGAIYASVIGGYYCRKLQQKTCSHGLLIGLGGLCYYIGDNLPPLIREHGKELGCNQDCVNVVQIFGIAMLGTATVTYLPVLTDVFSAQKVRKQMMTASVITFLLVVKLTNMDLVYTAIERATSYSCDEEVLIGTWVYYGVYIFLLLFSVYRLLKYVYQKTKENAITQENTTYKHTCVLAVVIALSITAVAASYILADNRLPLACSNITEMNKLGVRLGLWVATALFVLVVLVCLSCLKGTCTVYQDCYHLWEDNVESGPMGFSPIQMCRD